jgi:hypothetical protein
MPLDDAHLGDIFSSLENYFLRFSNLVLFFSRSRATTAQQRFLAVCSNSNEARSEVVA